MLCAYTRPRYHVSVYRTICPLVSDTFRKMSCNCASGKTGQRCETDIDLCELSPCFNASSCIVFNGEPRCGECPHGLSDYVNKCYGKFMKITVGFFIIWAF